MKIFTLLCAALGENIYNGAARASFWKELHARPGKSLFPALTCPAQATLRTAELPAQHGMIASGFYDRMLNKAFFWEQSANLYSGARIWENFRKNGGKVGQICLQQCPGRDSDFYLSPAPVHKHHGGMIQDFYCEPPELYRNICKETGKKFDLMQYWGPLTSMKPTEWIAAASVSMMKQLQEEKDVFLCAYLPALDYAPQKFGPDSAQAKADFTKLEAVIGGLYAEAKQLGFEFVVSGDYEITPVDTAVYPNRILAEAGLLKLREVKGMFYPNFHSSTAFALTDHQICHVYIADPEKIASVEKLLSGLPGIARISRREDLAALNHSRSGELILEAASNAWFAYPWWQEKRNAPDYATHIDIHNKPGFDPLEMFMEIFPPLSISQNASRIKGSHGRQGNVIFGSSFALDNDSADFLQLAKSLKLELDQA